jgi:Protein of unknown function (DUF3553)
MAFDSGTWVRNPKQPTWGVGRVVNHEDDKVRAVFSDVGEKLLDLRYATLEQVDPPANTNILRSGLQARRNVDMGSLTQVCQLFYEQFKDRRSNTNDGSMAMKVLDEMRTRGDLTVATAGQLFSWCHTGGSYTEGVDLAQQICRIVYGRVPTAAEVDAAGF